MKPKAVLIALVVVAILVAAGVRFKSPPVSTEPAAVPVGDSAVPNVGTPSHDVSPAAVSPSHIRSIRKEFSEDIAAGLLARIQQALASTNMADREFAMTNLLANLVQENPLLAARFAETNSIGDSRDELLRRIAQLWAGQDAQAALGWAGGLTNAVERDAVLTDVCLQVAENDPAAALRMREQFVTDTKANPALEVLAQRWAEQDFNAALSWTLARNSGEQRDQLVLRLAFVEAHSDPLNAATLAVEKIPPGPAQTEAVMSVLHQWALKDPTAAAAWVEQFPAGSLRERAVNELVNIERYRAATAGVAQ